MPTEIITETCPAPECNLLPVDIRQLVEELEVYHARFEPAFRRPEQAAWAAVYLKGLWGDVPRKTAERMALDPGENPRNLALSGAKPLADRRVAHDSPTVDR